MRDRFAGRYLLLRPLGEGGMGQVFLARDLSTGAECAIKRLRPREPGEDAESLRHEFEALVRVRHPAVVGVHDYGVSPEGDPYLVMEYVPGLPAERAVTRGDWRSACFVAAEVTDGLEALHRAGVFHGDLKPSNVLVTGSSAHPGEPAAVKLLDFGLAKLRPGQGAGHCGTPGFAAPELVAGAAASVASDLYGLGATLFAMLAGEPAFGGATAAERLRAQRNGPPSPLRLERLGVPPALIELVLRLLAPAPEERPEHARAVRLELEHLDPATRRSLADRLRTAVLVGRERELARIERWWRGDGARLAWLEGDTGAGKTSLLAELAARAALAGDAAVRVSCGSLESPGGVARAVLRALRARVPGAAPADGRAERWIASEDPLVEAEMAPLVDATARVAARVLVLLDDAEELEPASAAWLRRVALHPDAGAVRWVLARRAAATPPDEDRVLIAAGRAIRIELAPLAPEAVERLASERLHAAVPRELLDHLVREGAGHPGLTVELLRGAAEDGAILESDAGLRVRAEALGSGAGAAGFERLMLERLSREDPAGRRLLDALAGCGGPMRAEELDAVTPSAGVERLIASAWVLRDESGRLSLRSPAFAAALWRGLDSARRTELARALLALPGIARRQRFRLARDAGDAAAAFAHAENSFAEAPEPRFAAEVAALAETGDAALAATWHERAARCWRARGRYLEMRGHLESALALAPDAAGREERWVLLSTAVLRTGKPADVERVVEQALAVVVVGAARAQLLVNRASARVQAGDAAGERADGEAALALAREAGDAIATGLALELAARRACEAGDLDGAEKLSGQAADVFARAGHAHGVVRSTGFRAVLARRRFRFEDAERLLLEAIDAARPIENRLPLTEQLLYLSAIRAEAGRWTESREPSAEAARIALEDGRPSDAAAAIANLAQIEGLLGQPRAARRHARSAVRLCRQFQPGLASYAWRSLAQAERIAGRLRAAGHAARRALAVARGEERDWCALEAGRIAAMGGRWSEARAIWERVLGRGADRLPVTLCRIESGRAALRTADPAAAAARAEEAAAWIERQAPPYAAALLDLLRAEIAFAGHRSGEGVAAARRALATLARLTAPAERARAALDLASIVSPAAGLREAVGEWTRIAIVTFERLGDHRRREQALELALAWQRLPVPAATVTRDSGLLERVSWLLHSLTDLEELTRRAMRAVVEQLDAERGVLILTDPESGRLVPMAEFPESGALSAKSDAVRYSRRVAQQVTESGGSLLIEDAPSDPRAASESVKALRLRSILCVPMFLAERTVGAVYLDDSRRTHAFGDAERGLLEGFAHLMAVAIEKSRGHEEVQKEKERLEGENLTLLREIGPRLRANGMIGSSAPMQKVLVMMEHAARTQSTVLITGENGTGKELIARTLHQLSRRRLRPFVEVNCGAIPETLVESEMFGILASVATGVRERSGYFAQANGGTLMLDEIGDASLRTQVALLSAIANRTITPVGGKRALDVDVRIVAATNRDLRQLIAQKQFREDLFHRLNVIEIKVPPLRERKADIPALVRHFLEQFAAQQEREVPDLSSNFLSTVMRSDWPGNVRELQNYMERVMAMTPGKVLRPDPPPQDLEGHFVTLRATRARRLPDAVIELQERLIREALARASGNQSAAARELGLTEQTLRYRIRRLRLPPARQNRRTRYS